MTTVIINAPSAPVATVEPGADSLVPNAGLPDYFIKCPAICCAIRFDNCEWPYCFGCTGSEQTCCTEGEMYACKFVPKGVNVDSSLCCVLQSGEYDCTALEMRCKMYRQCFCIEWVCGWPLEETLPKLGDMVHAVESNDGTENILDAIPCSAACCRISSLYCALPGCLGCNSKTECLCIKDQTVAMKPMCWDNEKHNERSCCLVMKKNCVLYDRPLTCFKTMDQTCCIDSRCALPCDKEVPCMFTLLPFCVCCVEWKCLCACCQSVGQLTNQTNQPVPNQTTIQQVVIVQQAPAPMSVVYANGQPAQGTVVAATDNKI